MTSDRRSLRPKLSMLVALVAAIVLVFVAQASAALTPGDVVVYRVGTGSGALSSAAFPVFLNEYEPNGTLVESVALPTSTSSTGSGVNPATVPAPQTFTTDGAHGASGAVADFAGNVSAASSLTVQVDASAPSLAIDCPATATVGQSGVHATVAAADAQSGLAVDPSGSVPIDTAKAGSVTIERTASDNVGHSTTSSCTTDVENTQTIAGLLKKKLIVKSGEAVELTATTKAKAIEVQSGGALDIEGASTGGIKASGASQIRICAATVSGASKLTGTTGSVVVGDEAGCGGSSFKSGLTVTAGSGTVTVIGDQLGAKLTVTHNSGSATTVTHNTVAKALTVTANSGSVIDTPNSAKGKTKVQ